MNDITASANKIQSEATAARAAVSETLMTQLGSGINYAIENAQPVGSIIHSMLTEAQFQAIIGIKWVLMDGQSVVGSDYETITGDSSIPDGRGVFLRCENNGRSDGDENPDASALGDFQTDEFRSHEHRGFSAQSVGAGTSVALTTSNYPAFEETQGTPNSGYVYGIRGTAVGSSIGRTSASGGNETRAKNVTVNYFIKINE